MAGEGGDRVQRFKKWFWSIVEKMSPSERQDLVCVVSLLSRCLASFLFVLLLCLQCFDAVGWAAGRAPGL